MIFSKRRFTKILCFLGFLFFNEIQNREKDGMLLESMIKKNKEMFWKETF
jgi:hypothetical protein